MKKLFIILVLGVFALAASAQTTPTEVATDGYITQPTNKYVFGTTADTMTNADTVNFVWRVKGNWHQDFTVRLYADHVSGTAADSLVLFHSIDGENYESTGDTIVAAAVTADVLDLDVISITDFMYPYLKARVIQSGTAVTVPKVYFYTKRN